jgi:hypothetical protein
VLDTDAGREGSLAPQFYEVRDRLVAEAAAEEKAGAEGR